ncbi:MAG: 6-bladed beta-propeller [Dehalococcoidia bacterium]
MEPEIQQGDILGRRITRRSAIKAGGIAAVGLAFSRPIIETITPHPAFAQMSPAPTLTPIPPCAATGTFQFAFGTSGSGNGQFVVPIGIAVDAAGKIYVVDRNNHRVQVFNSAGTFQFAFGSVGSGNGQFAFPRRVAVDASCKIYVSDLNNDRVQVFS